jgi:hypothetical protein
MSAMPLVNRRLQRRGSLTSGRSVFWQWTLNDEPIGSIRIAADAALLRLTYRFTSTVGAAEPVEQVVAIGFTPCYFGGCRRWMIGPRCIRRVAVIYGDGKLFACRRCKALSYASQNEASEDRATRRAERIRKRMGWPISILDGPGDKPKSMRWVTFNRLLAEHDRLVGFVMAKPEAQLDRIRRIEATFGR